MSEMFDKIGFTMNRLDQDLAEVMKNFATLQQLLNQPQEKENVKMTTHREYQMAVNTEVNKKLAEQSSRISSLFQRVEWLEEKERQATQMQATPASSSPLQHDIHLANYQIKERDGRIAELENLLRVAEVQRSYWYVVANHPLLSEMGKMTS